MIKQPQNGQPTQDEAERQRKRYEEVLRRVTERVWQLWLADMRHDQERRGQQRRE